MTENRRTLVATLVVAVLAALLAVVAPAGAAVPPPRIRHVFVVNLENKGYDETFGPHSAAPYLSRTLRSRGQLLTQYYGTAHNSLPNYLAQISGQGPNPQTQGDCQVYSRFRQVATVAPGQAVGTGCVYPAHVKTVADQLEARGFTWKAYMQGMGRSCRHPADDTVDGTQKAKVGDEYAARHNPFVYFRSIRDRPTCRRHVVDLRRLRGDLGAVRTTANLTYITPDLCSDGHDSPCVDGRPGGLRSANTWLERWVPRILASPAYRRNGLLVITFDEADTESTSGADACCGEGPGPNSPLPGIFGPGGGRTGAVLLSPHIAAGSWNDTAYNHYGLLRSIENAFGLRPLGYAARARGFGYDVWGAR